DALPAGALARARATVAVRQQRLADACGAEISGYAVQVGGAVAQARLRPAHVRAAALGLLRRAAAGAVAAGLQRCGAGGAAGRGADRRGAGIRARRRARAAADAAAGAAVGGARLPRSVRRAGHVGARAGGPGYVASLALSAAGGVAAHAVDALAAR